MWERCKTAPPMAPASTTSMSIGKRDSDVLFHPNQPRAIDESVQEPRHTSAPTRLANHRSHRLEMAGGYVLDVPADFFNANFLH